MKESTDYKDTRRRVIDKAKELAKGGRHFRFFNVNGEIWECYRAEYIPDVGERAWLASKVQIYTIYDAPSEAQQFGTDL